MEEKTITTPLILCFQPEASTGNAASVYVRGLDQELTSILGSGERVDDLLRSVFRVTVVQSGGVPDGDGLPDVLGRYEVQGNELWFVPLFPFAKGVKYRATFDPGRLCGGWSSGKLTLDFSPPSPEIYPPAEVEAVFPSADLLPENLLRFYVRFSRPMEHGQAAQQIALFDSGGRPVADALYRAPVELWDRSMRHLTILLDPGRLKRGVGPNVALGPPLRIGQEYTLLVGAGMLDAASQPLRQEFRKRFRIGEASRESVDIQRWKLEPPDVGSRGALTLLFPEPLDWAMLWRSIAVETADGLAVEGRITHGNDERCWCFNPASSWTAETYRVRVSPDLEDVCGNNVAAAFDGPLQSKNQIVREQATRFITFQPRCAAKSLRPAKTPFHQTS